MIISFATKRLRVQCERRHRAESDFGVAVAARLIARLADLREAITASELTIGSPQIQGDRIRYLLADGYSLHVGPNHAKVPQLSDETVDWSKVTRIQILEITNNHG